MNEMQPKRKAVYAGSFDPPTKGHEWVIKTAAGLFDELVVAIGTNPAKKAMFTPDERTEMLCSYILPCYRCVSLSVFHNQMLVNYAKSIGALYIVRGIRNESDYEYERTMRYINADRNPEIQTVFLIPPRELVEVSSGAVKNMIGPQGWETFVQPYVNEFVFNKLKEQHGRNP